MPVIFHARKTFKSCIVETTSASRFDHGCTSNSFHLVGLANVESFSNILRADVEESQEER